MYWCIVACNRNCTRDFDTIMKYPVRCRIVNPTGEPFVPGIVKNAPEESMPHIGKEGLAEEIEGNVRITLDDGTIL